MDLPGTIPAWTDWLRAAERTDGTIRLRQWHVERYLRETADAPLALNSFARHLANPRWSPATRRSVRNSLHLWTTWLHITGAISTDPLRQLPPIIQPRALPRPCPERVITRALDLARNDRRLTALLFLAADAGLRRAEMSQVSRHDLVQDLIGTSLLVHGKGRRERMVPLSAGAVAAIERQLSTVPPDVPWLFPSTGRYSHTHIGPIRVGEIINDSLPAPWTAHTLRHSFATRAYRSSSDLLLVQSLLGHSKPETTATYVGLDTSRARAVVTSISLHTAA